jgi:hypothetical protein
VTQLDVPQRELPEQFPLRPEIGGKGQEAAEHELRQKQLSPEGGSARKRKSPSAGATRT